MVCVVQVRQWVASGVVEEDVARAVAGLLGTSGLGEKIAERVEWNEWLHAARKRVRATPCARVVAARVENGGGVSQVKRRLPWRPRGVSWPVGLLLTFRFRNEMCYYVSKGVGYCAELGMSESVPRLGGLSSYLGMTLFPVTHEGWV